ncbi:MAG TPA: hypothetical protein VEF53_03290, partial [Patescibacteria group bacterium]|nr:hypothetical protein [Patescibacteria group bacterium]
ACSNGTSSSTFSSNSESDIKSIEPYSKSDSLKNNEIELKYANVYKKISTDTSSDAMRGIGKIQNKKITAKEIELEALKLQLSGDKKIYSNAWDELKIGIVESELAEQYNIDFQKDAVELVKQNLKYFKESKDEATIKYTQELYKAFGMTEDEYWNEYALNLYLKQLCHERVTKYLKDNNLPEIEPSQIQGEITDKKYLEKIDSEEN